MQKPPLQLKDHIFPTIVVQASRSIKLEDLKPDRDFGYAFEFGVRLLKTKDNELQYQVELFIKTKELEGKLKGYDVELNVTGLFEVEKGFPAEERDAMVNVLGPTMLYGSARELLYTLTSRGPYPPIYLPTVSFVEDPPKKKTTKRKQKNR